MKKNIESQKIINKKIKKGGEIIMKKFFILLMVVLMLAGLTFTTFAGQNGNEYAYNQEDGPLRDGSCKDWPNPEECKPVGDKHKYKGDRWL